MKLRYLGTAAAEGFPGIFCRCEVCRRARTLGGKDLRRRSGALLDGRLLIDMPPDLYGLSLLFGVDLSQVPDLLVTHVHPDHFYLHELVNIAPAYAQRPGAAALRFHGSATVQEAFREKFGAKLEGLVQQMTVEFFRPVVIGEYTVTPLPAHHSAALSMIYHIESAGRSLLYANDTGLPRQEVWDWLKGRRLDLVSMDCTMVDGPSYEMHMGINDNKHMRRRLLDLGCADNETKFVATHFSHNGLLLHAEIERRFADAGVLVAYDGLEVEV